MYNNLGGLLREANKLDEALAHYQKALTIQKQLVKKHETSTGYQANLADTYHNLGNLLVDKRHWAGARRAFDDARAIRERLARTAPAEPAYRRDLPGTLDSLPEYLDLQREKGAARSALANTLGSLGALQRERGQPDKALADYERARKLRTSLVLQYPEVAEYQSDLARTWYDLGLLQRERNKPEEARKSYKRAFALQDPLTRKHPEVTPYQMDLGNTCVQLGNLIRDGGKPGEALSWYARVIPMLRKVLAREGDLQPAREVLCTAYQGEARALGALGRHREAAGDWAEAARLHTRSERDCRQELAYSLARTGDHAKAMAEVADLEKSAGKQGRALYELACISALASAAAARDTGLSPAERQKEADACAVRAVELLGRAAGVGLFKDRSVRDHLDKDRDLEPIRGRDDFRKLLATLTKP
jgi:tetratricopeptide (TPR) repeat protein